jgi:hypothetical protein
MPDLLTDVFCGIGAMYLAIHIGCFVHRILPRFRPSEPAPRPGFDPKRYKDERTMHEVRTP